MRRETTAVMFGSASDEWATPDATFEALRQEFDFVVDLAAQRYNRKCPLYVGPDSPHGDNWRDYLTFPVSALLAGTVDAAAWLNPPYSKCRQFIAKAAQDARSGCTIVALVPSRTDTRWWHSDVWDAEKHQPRPGVEVRFIKGRLKFGEGKNSAPFPSVVVVFRPVGDGHVA
jgi:site-specific DNA-methyltransferase (adenine-specific)